MEKVMELEAKLAKLQKSQAEAEQKLAQALSEIARLEAKIGDALTAGKEADMAEIHALRDDADKQRLILASLLKQIRAAEAELEQAKRDAYERKKAELEAGVEQREAEMLKTLDKLYEQAADLSAYMYGANLALGISNSRGALRTQTLPVSTVLDMVDRWLGKHTFSPKVERLQAELGIRSQKARAEFVEQKIAEYRQSLGG